MSYENASRICYNFAANDFGNGDVTRKLRPPQGKNGFRVSGIHLAATEVFTQTTTQAEVQVGLTGDLDKYAVVPCGALAANASLADGDVTNALKGSFHLDDEGITELTLTLLAPTGGTPSGIADVMVAVDWF